MSASCGSRATDSLNSLSALMNAASTDESSSTTSRCFTGLRSVGLYAVGRRAAAAGRLRPAPDAQRGPLTFDGGFEGDPLLRPVGDRIDGRRERAPFSRQRIFP